MTRTHRFRNTLAALATGLALLAAGTANAQSMVSVKGSILNMRSGPGTHTEVLWELRKGYPLKVVARKGSWLQVRDFENDRGWVARSLTGATPHHIVKAKTANIRQGPGTQHRIVGKAEYGELLRTREKRTGWVRVERDNGKTGWIAKRLLWGW
ncbi:SH3 domain-containing protein [Hydrogenophaga sp. ZJX-1]|uniref:SH3 domain-containing protein n=1 Tax=Hydrogenophaga sp. ZJX-1 TaxID=3404778 RepID=UPI003B2889C0